MTRSSNGDQIHRDQQWGSLHHQVAFEPSLKLATLPDRPPDAIEIVVATPMSFSHSVRISTGARSPDAAPHSRLAAHLVWLRATPVQAANAAAPMQPDQHGHPCHMRLILVVNLVFGASVTGLRRRRQLRLRRLRASLQL
jgi:hypothetical protein